MRRPCQATSEHAIFSIHYLPRGLHTMLRRSIDLVADAPWFRLNWTGTSILLTMPALLWLWRARDRSLLVPWLTVALILAPDLLHGVSGFAQFGYRFSCDMLPILWWLLAWVVVHHGLTFGLRIALVAGIFVNVDGLVAIWGLCFASYGRAARAPSSGATSVCLPRVAGRSCGARVPVRDRRHSQMGGREP